VVSESAASEIGTDFLDIRFERICHGKGFPASHLKDRPVDDIVREKPFVLAGWMVFGRRATGQ
jgi:hypothetical protein